MIDDVGVFLWRMVLLCIISAAATTIGEFFVGVWASVVVGAALVVYAFGALFGQWTLLGYDLQKERMVSASDST